MKRVLSCFSALLVLSVAAMANATLLEPDSVTFYEGASYYSADTSFSSTQGTLSIYTVPGTISSEDMDEVTAIYVVTEYYSSGLFSSVDWYYYSLPDEDFFTSCDTESTFTVGQYKAYWMYNNPSIPGTPPTKWDYVDEVGVAAYTYYEGATGRAAVIYTEAEI